VQCRAAARPMWAAKEPEPSGDVVTRMITKEISSCTCIPDLEDVCSKWIGRFDHIHAAAALVKLAKMSSRGRAEPALFKQLASLWLELLPDAQLQGCATVLWACAKLGVVSDAQLWNRTWAAFFSLLVEKVENGSTVTPQNVSIVLWACAKVRKQPTADEHQLLMHALLQPDAVSAAKAQAIANTVWALGRLQQLSGWQGGVSEQDIQQLLGQGQLQMLITSDNNQAVSNVLMSLALLATGPHSLLSLSFSQHAAKQLITGTSPGSLKSWKLQHITMSMWACGELGLFDEQFMAAAVAAAPQWVPKAANPEVVQALAACAQLQYRDYGFLQQLLQQGLQLLQLQPGERVGRLRPLSPADKASLAALCSLSIAQLDMRELAGAAKALVASSGIGKQARTHPSNLWRLRVFHSWLLQHQLLDGQGLTGLLTEQQLQQGEKESAVFGDK